MKWGWFWGIACLVIVVFVTPAVTMFAVGIVSAESECLKAHIREGLELSEEEARRADWQTYYREALDVCRFIAEDEGS